MHMLKQFLNRLLLPGFSSSWSQSVYIQTAPKSVEDLQRALRDSKPGHPVDIFLKDSLILKKSHRLPKKARRQSANILKLRAKALSTISKTELVAVYERSASSKDEDTYLQFLTRKDDINTIRYLFTQLSFPVRSIAYESNARYLLFWDNRDKVDRTFYRWWLATAVFAMIVCGYFLANEMSLKAQLSKQLEVVQIELNELQQAVNVASSRRDGASEQSARAEAVLEDISSYQLSTVLLHNLTTQLPTEAWITELTIEDARSIHISGTTTMDPIDIIARLESANWIANLALVHPFRTDNRTGQSNFELLLEVDPKAL